MARYYYSITSPRGFANEVFVRAFTSRAARDVDVARYAADPHGRSEPATRREAEAQLAANRRAAALHTANSAYSQEFGSRAPIAEIRALASL